MKKVIVTGSQGFIGSYICLELLSKGYKIIGIDNYSKYGYVERSHDDHPNFTLLEMDVCGLKKKRHEIFELLKDADYIIAAAAMIGGISYFHKYAYDLLANNERIMASTFDLAIELYREQSLNKIVVISSSMVFESTSCYPTPEGEEKRCPPPLSTYGFQKLATEYFCYGANEQYNLPYTIIRPFNCVGVGEDEALGEDEMIIGNMKMLLSHVLPDLIYKSLHLESTDKLPILGEGNQVRHYTNGKDIAKGIVLAMESDAALNEDFNISTSQPTSVKQLAELVWKKIHGTNLELEICKPFEYDVQIRSPDVSKAKKLLGFEAKISLEDSINEVIEWMKEQYEK